MTNSHGGDLHCKTQIQVCLNILRVALAMGYQTTSTCFYQMVNLAPGFKVAKVSDLTTKFETIFKLLTYFLSCSIKSYFVYFIDHASARYIFTRMSPLAQLIFNPKDEKILTYTTEDNQQVEPKWYIPILPMVLVNGADGIGTGWMTKIPNYNPRDLVEI